MWWHHNRFLRISAVSWVPQHRSYCIIHLFFNLFLGCGGIITDSSGYLLSPGYPTQVLLYNSSILQSVSRMWWHHHRFLRISAVSLVPQHRSYCIIHQFFNLFLGCGGIITDSSGYLLSPGYPTQVLLYNSSILQSVSRMWSHHHRFLGISDISWVPQHRSHCIIHQFSNLFLGCGGIITDSSGYLLSPGYSNTSLTV